MCDRGFLILVFAVRIDLTLDCANATRLAEFWKLALGYQDEPPPAPFAARQEWLQQVDPGASADDGAWLCDPEGVGPRLSLLRVPEPKVAKNRLHMDVRVAGATALQPFPGHHVVIGQRVLRLLMPVGAAWGLGARGCRDRTA